MHLVSTDDKAGKAYWEQVWENEKLPAAIEPERPGWLNYLNRARHRYFARAFSGMETRGKQLLEIGCGRSVWLPHFARHFGFEVTGIDYSESGCRQAEQILRRGGTRGRVVCADAFQPPAELLGSFDVVVSQGVVEHFRDTAKCVAAFAAYLRPGGLMVTTIPNFAGLHGTLQRWLNRKVYEVHVPLDAETLAAAHRASGLEVRSCEYFLFVNFGVLNSGAGAGLASKLLLYAAQTLAVRPVWFLERRLPLFPANAWTSPYIHCLAAKPAGRGPA